MRSAIAVTFLSKTQRSLQSFKDFYANESEKLRAECVALCAPGPGKITAEVVHRSLEKFREEFGETYRRSSKTQEEMHNTISERVNAIEKEATSVPEAELVRAMEEKGRL